MYNVLFLHLFLICVIITDYYRRDRPFKCIMQVIGRNCARIIVRIICTPPVTASVKYDFTQFKSALFARNVFLFQK